MTLISEHIEPDTRERILVVAERLFRQIGYQKTTVADIAKELRMSPANVYRFFESKKAINEGVARVLMGEVEDIAVITGARPSYVGSVLQEAGLHSGYFDLYTSTAHPQNIYSKFFAGKLGFKDEETAPLHIQSPISLLHALTFGLLFVLITLTAQIARKLLGPAGFLLVTTLGGLVSSASTSAAAGILASKGALPPELAGYGVVLTSMASLIFHIPMAQMAGRNSEVTARLARLSIVILVAGFIGLAAQALLFPHLL